MPKDEIWLKIGGDHGSDSFKICLQILNVDNPNAKEKTNVIAFMQAKDSHENLRTITKIHKDQIEGLSSQTWKNKRFRLFIFGDYVFHDSLYGLSGAKGPTAVYGPTFNKKSCKFH